MAFDRQCNKIVCPAFAKAIQTLAAEISLLTLQVRVKSEISALAEKNLIFGEGFGIINSLLKEVTTEYKMFGLGMRHSRPMPAVC